MGKYDFIDKHYQETREVLAQLVGAELHEACVRFPPAVGEDAWDNTTFERRFKHTLPQLPPPDAAMILLLCTFLDLEIDHEVEDIDRRVKSGAVQALCPTAAHVETFHFLWQWLLHMLEERSAKMTVPFKSPDKHRIVESLHQRVGLMHLGNTPLH